MKIEKLLDNIINNIEKERKEIKGYWKDGSNTQDELYTLSTLYHLSNILKNVKAEIKEGITKHST